MPTSSTTRSYIGVGRFSLRQVDSASSAFYEVGNVLNASFNYEEQKIELANALTPGGGQLETLVRVQAIRGVMNTSELSPRNLARVLRATLQDAAGATAQTQAIVVDTEDAYYPFDHAVDPASTVTFTAAFTTAGTARQDTTAVALNEIVTTGSASTLRRFRVTTAGTTDATPPAGLAAAAVGDAVTDGTAVLTLLSIGATPALVEGVDYINRRSGLFVPKGSSLVNNATVTATFDTADTVSLQALKDSSKLYELRFEGLNEADSNNPVRIHVFKVRFGAAITVPAINTDAFATYDINFDCLADESRPSTDSQYMKIEMLQ